MAGRRRRDGIRLLFCGVAVLAIATFGWGQTCSTSDEMDAGKRASLTNAATQYFQLAQQGNTASLQQNATPDFTDVAGTISENKDAFSGAPTTKAAYLLDNSAPGRTGKSQGRTEFFCGIFNSPDRVGFVFPSLPDGLYAVVLQQSTSQKGSYNLSWILAQAGNTWKIAGLILKPTTVNSHDGQWFAQQARNYKSKGQIHNAWFYYVMADELLRPFPAISTPDLDKLYDEFAGSHPADVPMGQPVELSAAGKTYRLTAMFPAVVGNDVDLVVKYQTDDLSNTAKVYDENTNVIKAVVSKYPELRSAFGGVVARAVAPSGQDYGTLLAMKDLK